MDTLLYVVLFVVPAALGVRATWRLWQVYRYDEGTRSQLILLSFAVIATLITLAALWFGFLGVRRLLGFEALEWTPPVSVVLSAVILLIPAGLERLVDYVGRRPPDPERPGR